MKESVEEFGIVSEVLYPVVRVSGLPSVIAGELVKFASDGMGIVFSLEADTVDVLVMDTGEVPIGTRVTPLGLTPSISSGGNYLGSVIDPIGNAIGGKTVKPTGEQYALDVRPGGIATRSQIKAPFVTGVSLIDLMLPLGLGQKELVLGDRKSGKTSLLLSILKNQAQQGVKVVYAAIGKKRQEIASLHEFLKREELLSHVTVVATTPDDSPSLIYLTPLTAMSLAESMRDSGVSTLVIFDDLTTHAKYYREISLLAGRFPGRESYPGDMFHVHAKLLERAGNFLHEKGDVSVTALPVAEIYEGDLTSHVATNLMSITDGHIFLDSNIFNQGRRPAINVPLSVTRVGRQAHSALIRSINRELSSFQVLYVKMQELSHFGAELTDTVKSVLITGETLNRFFEQPRGASYPLEAQVILFALLWLKQFSNVSLSDIASYRDKLSGAVVHEKNAQLIQEMMNTQTLNELLAKVQKDSEALKKLCV